MSILFHAWKPSAIFRYRAAHIYTVHAFGWHCHGGSGLRSHPGGSVAKGMTKISYSGYRFPPEIIQQAIWLYVRFTLSFRDVEDLLAERGIVVSYETVRRWVNHLVLLCHKRNRVAGDWGVD
jgi:hypothetical protein